MFAAPLDSISSEENSLAIYLYEKQRFEENQQAFTSSALMLDKISELKTKRMKAILAARKALDAQK